MGITDAYYADAKVSLGVPYSIAAYEELLAIGSSDGEVRLYDNYEKELRVLSEKSLKGSATLCLDMKRIRTDNIFIVSGHAKG